MIRASFTLLLTLLLLAAGGLWALGELERGEGAQRAGPRLRSVDLDSLRREAAATLGAASRALSGPAEPGPQEPLEPAAEAPAAPPLEETALPVGSEFAEAPLPEPPAQADPKAERPDAPLVVASRDQDAWADLIRRMLALHRRAGGR